MTAPELRGALDAAREMKRTGRFSAAKVAFEDPILVAHLGDMDARDRFAYQFEYGTTLGELGELEAMDTFLTQALSTAAEELEDIERCKQVWWWLLHLVRASERWGFLEKQCQSAAEFGRAVASGSIRQMAAEFCAYAHRGQGRTEEARIGGETILKRLEAIGADDERLGEWRDFLASLG